RKRLLQQQTRKPEGDSFGLGSRRRQMERQNHRARRARPGAGERADAFFLSPYGHRPDFHQEAVRRDGRDALPRLPPEYRLARERQSEPVLFLRGYRQGETPGTA